MLQKLLNYKPGSVFCIVCVLILFFGMVLITQYRTTGHINLRKMVDRDADLKPFWDRNPQLESIDSYPHTSLVVVRDRSTGRTAMLDLAVGLEAQVRPLSCEHASGFSEEMIPRDAGERACWMIDKPDTGAGTSYVYAASFSTKSKDSQVEQFYRSLFISRGKQVTVIRNSSSAIILEAENEDHDTVARISIRGSFDTSQSFLAWTKDFH